MDQKLHLQPGERPVVVEDNQVVATPASEAEAAQVAAERRKKLGEAGTAPDVSVKQTLHG